MNIDEQHQRMTMRRLQFEDRLRAFVEMWAPKDDRYDRDTFQRELLMLMREGMHYEIATFGHRIEQYTSKALMELSMVPLTAIFEGPKQ